MPQMNVGQTEDSTPAQKGPMVKTVRPELKSSAVEWGKQIWGEFTHQHGDLAAAAVAIFGILSLVPMMLLAVWIFVNSIAHSSEDAWSQLRPHLEQLLSAASSSPKENILLTTVHDMVMSHGAAGLVGALGLAWSGSRIFNIITETFDESWRIEQGRSFIKQNIFSLIMLVILGVIFMGSIVAVAAVGYFVKIFSGFLPPEAADILGSAVSIVLNILTAIALFTALYKWAPNRRVPWKAAIFGGVIGGTLWALFLQLFGFYLHHFNSYNKAYGAMGAFVILILWAYYSSYILILGSVASAVYSEKVLGERGPDETTEPGKKSKQARGKEMAEEGKTTPQHAGSAPGTDDGVGKKP